MLSIRVCSYWSRFRRSPRPSALDALQLVRLLRGMGLHDRRHGRLCIIRPDQFRICQSHRYLYLHLRGRLLFWHHALTSSISCRSPFLRDARKGHGLLLFGCQRWRFAQPIRLAGLLEGNRLENLHRIRCLVCCADCSLLLLA